MRRSRIATVLAAATLALCATAVIGQEIDAELSRHFTAAQQAQSAGNFGLAVQEYQAVLKLSPNLPEAEANLGLIYYLQTRYQESAQAFEKALSAKPDVRGAHLFLGIDYAKLGHVKQAIPFLRQAVEQEPANKIARSWLCTVLWDAGDEALAMDELRRAARMFPNDADILFLLGQAYRNAADEETGGGHDSAARSYREKTLAVLSQMLAADPNSVRTHQLFGQVLAESGKNDEALAEYRKVESKTPSVVGLHFAIGELLWKMNKPGEALAEFQQELRLNPGYAEASAAEGSILVIEHQPDRAIPHLEKALALKPGLLLAHRELGKAFYQSHQYAKAEREFLSALKDDPDGDVHYLLATVYKQLGNQAKAGAFFAEARRIKSRRWETDSKQLTAAQSDPAAQFRTAEEDLRSGQTQQAIRLIETLEKQPGLSVAQEFELAELLNSKQLYPQVVARLRRIVQAEPERWANKYNLGVALLEAKQPVEAIRTLEEVSKQYPQNAAVLDLLGMAYESGEQPERALASYRKAVAVEPANHDYYLDYTRLLIELDRYSESERFLESGLQRLNGDYALTMRLGSLQMMQGKLEDARQTFQKAIHAQPSIALGYVALAQTYLRERRDPEALNLLAAARAKVTPDPMLDHYYGLTLVRLERYREAIAPLENAARMNPDEAETHYLLGKSYAALGHLEAARGEFEQTIRLNPQHAGAYYQLSRIYGRLGDAAKARTMAERVRELDQARRDDDAKAQRARLAKLEGREQP